MRTKKNKRQTGKLAVLAAIIVILVLVLAAVLILWLTRTSDEPQPSADDVQPDTSEQSPVEPSRDSEMDYELPTTERPDPMYISEELEIEEISSYVGIFMEDGSDEVVNGVMMLVLKNTGKQDLQLAQIQVIYEDFTAEFEASNVPAGERIVLLEKNRAAMPVGEPKAVETGHVIFFSEPMSLCEEQFEITGGNGYLDVKNISGEDISGLIRVFYKNAGPDLLYGGITYMATVQDGIPAGETVRIMTSHYSESSSRILHVVCGE